MRRLTQYRIRFAIRTLLAAALLVTIPIKTGNWWYDWAMEVYLWMHGNPSTPAGGGGGGGFYDASDAPNGGW